MWYSWGGMVSARCIKPEHSLKQGRCFSCGCTHSGAQCRHSPSLLTCTMLPWPLSPLLQHFSPLFSAALCLMPAWRSFSLNTEHAKACQNYDIRKYVESISSKWEVLLLIFSYIFFLGGDGGCLSFGPILSHACIFHRVNQCNYHFRYCRQPTTVGR